MRAASTAAFFALSTPTVATGTPGGICTIESSASSPSRTLFEERSGTPITGSSVCAAQTPGSAAARPATAISTFSPRPAADSQYSATAFGARWAERTSNSHAMPRASSSSIAACIRSRSDSLPTRMPTSGSDTGGRLQCDVVAVAHVLERDLLRCSVGAVARLAEVVADRGDVQDPATVGDELLSATRRRRVEHERPAGLRLLDPEDRRAVVPSLGIGARGEHDRDRGAVAHRERRELAARRVVAGGQQVAVQERQDHLGLRVAEPAVELE